MPPCELCDNDNMTMKHILTSGADLYDLRLRCCGDSILNTLKENSLRNVMCVSNGSTPVQSYTARLKYVDQKTVNVFLQNIGSEDEFTGDLSLTLIISKIK